MLRAGEPASEHDRGAPSPTLDDLEDLLARYRSAGISVRAEVVGPVAALDTSRSVAGYRIVQEAMTNVSKHSPTAETNVTVHVDAAGGACRIVVASRGGRTSAAGGPRASSVWSACVNGRGPWAARSTRGRSRTVGRCRPSCRP